MYSEDDLLPLSALQHLVYCSRQCALIHIEQAWSENRYTAEGNLLHRRSDAPGTETRGGLRAARGLRIHSLRLGLAGIADVVEFHRVEGLDGISLPGVGGRWQPVPVEYKRGRPKADDCDQVQLAAQAMCLEEMLGATINEGFLYYGKTRHRERVAVDQSLRQRTEALASELHALFESGITPPAEVGAKCDQCSLRSICLPELGRDHDVGRYLDKMLRDP